MLRACAGSSEDSRESSSVRGESSFSESERLMPRALARGEGVLAGEDFCGEMDLARSKGGQDD